MDSREPALARIESLGGPDVDVDEAREVALELLRRWREDEAVVVAIGEAAESLVDLRTPSAAPPEHPLFGALIEALGRVDEPRAWSALATVARVCGRERDDVAEEAHRKRIERFGRDWGVWYDYGLFLKYRGRFFESLQANRRALDLGADEERVQWNLGIAATGAGDGHRALEVWRSIGCTLEMTEGGLPEGRWAAVQVRLAEFPVCQRISDEGGPGREETIWVERLSPCHGRVRSALYQDLGVDYGDLVLFDGAPILWRDWGDQRVPVFPHLGTLERGGWWIGRFGARQAERGQVAALTEALPGDSEVYVHSESMRRLCRSCWESGAHVHHEPQEHRVVTGKICVDPGVELAAFSEALDEAAGEVGIELYVPDLRREVGDAREEVDERRLSMILGGA